MRFQKLLDFRNATKKISAMMPSPEDPQRDTTTWGPGTRTHPHRACVLGVGRFETCVQVGEYLVGSHGSGVCSAGLRTGRLTSQEVEPGSVRVAVTGSGVVAAHATGALELMDDECRVVQRQETGASKIWCVAGSKDDVYLALQVERTYELVRWSLIQGQALARTPLGDKPVALAVVSKNGRVVVCGRRELRLYTIDDETLTCVAWAKAQSNYFTALAYEEGDRLATAHRDGSMRLWSKTLRPVTELHWHASRVGALAFGARSLLYSGGDEGVLVVWKDHGGRDYLPRLGAPIVHLLAASLEDLPNLVIVTCKDHAVHAVVVPGLRRLWSLRGAAVRPPDPPPTEASRGRSLKGKGGDVGFLLSDVSTNADQPMTTRKKAQSPTTTKPKKKKKQRRRSEEEKNQQPPAEEEAEEPRRPNQRRVGLVSWTPKKRLMGLTNGRPGYLDVYDAETDSVVATVDVVPHNRIRSVVDVDARTPVVVLAATGDGFLGTVDAWRPFDPTKPIDENEDQDFKLWGGGDPYVLEAIVRGPHGRGVVVTGMAIHPTIVAIATCGVDGTAKLWARLRNPDAWAAVLAYAGDESPVHSLAFSSDASLLALGRNGSRAVDFIDGITFTLTSRLSDDSQDDEADLDDDEQVHRRRRDSVGLLSFLDDTGSILAACGTGFSVRSVHSDDDAAEGYKYRAPIAAAAVAPTTILDDGQPSIAVAVRAATRRSRSILLFHHSKPEPLINVDLLANPNPTDLLFLSDGSLVALLPTHILHLITDESNRSETKKNLDDDVVVVPNKKGIHDVVVTVGGDPIAGDTTFLRKKVTLNPRPTWDRHVDDQPDIGAMFDAYVRNHLIHSSM